MGHFSETLKKFSVKKEQKVVGSLSKGGHPSSC